MVKLTAWRAVHPDLRSSNGFRWPFPDKKAVAPLPEGFEFTRGNPCPGFVGDGLCLAKTWAGAASGGIPAITCLEVTYKPEHVLGEDGDKVRVSECRVVEVFDAAGLIRDGWMARANLTGANLSGADLTRADLTGAYLTGAYLYGADLTGANLTGADLSRADLTGAYLTRADLTGADLTGADLTGANLTRADLTGANLTGAYLTGADLSRADLTGAYLSRADLTGADLTGADLSRAYLSRADLTGAYGRDDWDALVEGGALR